MLYFFFYFSSSTSFYLSNKNYTTVFDNSSTKSIFLYTFNNFCENCKNYDLIWETVSNMPNYNEQVVFASINCEKEEKLCKKYNLNYNQNPSFYWFSTPILSFELFTDNISIENLTNFIDSKLKSPLIKIKKQKSVEMLEQTINNKYRNSSKYDQYFIFNVSSKENKENIQLIERITSHFKYLPVLYFFVNDTYSTSYHPPILHIFAPKTDRKTNIDDEYGRIVMKNDFTYENIEKFIRVRSFHRLAQHSPMFDDFSLKYKVPIAIFVQPDSEGKNVDEYANITEHYMLTTQTTCIINPYICRYCNQWPKDGKPYLAVVNRSTRTFWVFDKDFNDIDISHFIDDAYEHQLKGYGPGPSIIGNVLNFYYELRERGGMPYYTAHVPIMVFTILGSIFLYVSGDSIAGKYKILVARREAERKQREKIAEIERQKRNRNKLKNK